MKEIREDALYAVNQECLMLILLKEVNGGLGIEQNIVTLCAKCHYEEDFGLNTKIYGECIEDYLKAIYGVNWDKEKLVYKKY